VARADADSPDQPQPEGRPSGQNLPAPYQDPFRSLSDDLQAVVATLRLRAQELWRRNRQGDLSVPGFWPQDLAPLFWPVVVAVALAVLIALPVGLVRLWPAQAPAQPEQPEKLVTTPLPQARPTAEPLPLEEPLPLAEPLAAPSPLEVPAAEAEPEPAPFLAAEPEPLQLELDPLMELLGQGDPRHLIASAHPDPSAGVLELQLTSAFALLPEAERRSEADHWLERSQALGYDRLVLVDQAGLQLGRQALVGSGMILLDLKPPS